MHGRNFLINLGNTARAESEEQAPQRSSQADLPSIKGIPSMPACEGISRPNFIIGTAENVVAGHGSMKKKETYTQYTVIQRR